MLPNTGQTSHLMCDVAHGFQDEPGYAALPRIHKDLFVGNRVSAACAEVPFDRVVSTYPCVYRHGADASHLTSVNIPFHDGEGSETEEQKQIAIAMIEEGATRTWEFLNAGHRTLVNCKFGQNRSGAICAAVGILYLGWKPDEVIEYIKEENLSQRSYAGQDPMHNTAFNQLLCELVPKVVKPDVCSGLLHEQHPARLCMPFSKGTAEEGGE